MIGGFGKIDNQSFLFIGQQKGFNTKTRQYRNFGMANPEGYRKALRLMKSAEKFNIPIVTLIDTPGAFPGLEAEERGQGEAIARNIFEMFNLKTQIISIVIGEGASGGAVGFAIGDHVLMLVFSLVCGPRPTLPVIAISIFLTIATRRGPISFFNRTSLNLKAGAPQLKA